MSRAVLLIGSPKPGKSASRTFAEALGQRMDAREFETRVERIGPIIRDEEALAALLGDIVTADVVVLSFPVYWDSLPAPVLRFLEAWAAGLADGSLPASAPRLAVLTQCGFPEASHCQVAIDVCRLFAAENGVGWAGALAFGMGGSIAGGSVERSPLGPRMKAFDAAADALSAGGSIPESSTEAFARPLVPAWGYPLLGGWLWGQQAKKNGCTEPLTCKPYVR